MISPSGVKKVYDTKQDASNYNLASGYTLNEVGVYTVTVDVVDSNGNYTTEATIGGIESGVDHGEGSSTASTTYHITVTDRIEGHNVTSTDIQGVTQTGTPNFTSVGDGSPVVPSATSPAKLVNPTSGELVDEVTINGQGTYTINNATGVVTFVPLNTFIGTATPVTVSLTTTLGQDLSGNPITATATATYTPTVTEVVPTAKESETKDIQGAVQKSPVVFDVKDEEDKSTVNFDRGDERVELNKSTLTLVNAAGEKVNEVVIANEGKYVLKDGVIEFTPEKQFVGKATSVTVQVEDVNGKVATTKYTPEVVGVQPTATPAETTDIQGVPQKGVPEFLGGRVSVNGVEKIVPIDETKGLELTNPETGEKGDVITVPGEGKYEVNNGVVVFTPEPQFIGKAKGVNVTRVDMNGTPVTAKYTPTVAPIKPTGENVTSTDIQGKVQEGIPVFTEGDKRVPIEITDKKPAKFIVGGKEVDATEIPATKEGKEVGKYTLDKNTGKVTFTPNKDFVGTPDSATVQVQDKNGTPATATYTPTVTPVKPEGIPAKSTDIQGKVQTGKPEFKPGNPEVPMDEEVPATFEDGQTTKTVDKVGTYTVAKDGTVTFTPEKTFTGEAPAVTVKRVDKNGTSVTATYTPTVIEVTPTGEVSETEGARGTVQKSPIVFDAPDQDNTTVNFNKGHEKVALDKSTLTLVDKTGKEMKEVIVPGEGTYVLKDGVIEFTPEKDFVGRASGVTVQVKDENGKVVSKTYTPTVRPITSFKDKEGNEIPKYPSEPGTVDKKDIPEYRFVETKKLPNGDTEHVYEKVKTSFKDKEGNEIPKYPSEPGTVDKKDIPEYRFVESKKLPNGDTEHVYEKVNTFFKDKEGNEIPKYPSEPGTVDKKDIPEYRFVETKKLPNGDTEHVYEKVKTSFKDKEGNEIPKYPSEPGTVDKKDIPEYRFVESKKLPNGDTEHIYEKVTTPTPVIEKTTSWIDENGNPLKSTEKGIKDPGSIPGYELVKTTVDSDGNKVHIFKKLTTLVPEVKEKRLANTGTTETNSSLAGLGLAILGLATARKRRRDK